MKHSIFLHGFKIRKCNYKLLFTTIILSLNYTFSNGQHVSNQDPIQELYQTLLKLDSMVFENAFEICDYRQVSEFFTKDFEFYHDKGGFITSSLEQAIAQNKERCANWFVDGLPKTKRELIKNSVKVFPMNNYGAIQTGEHRFYSLMEDKTYRLVEQAKFTHLWKLDESGIWKISRVLSYDHQPIE